MQCLSEVSLPWGIKCHTAVIKGHSDSLRAPQPAGHIYTTHTLLCLGCSPPQCRVRCVRNSRAESLTSQHGLHRRFCSMGNSSVPGRGGQWPLGSHSAFPEGHPAQLPAAPTPALQLDRALQGASITSNEQQGIGAEVRAAGGLVRVLEPSECGLEGLL